MSFPHDDRFWVDVRDVVRSFHDGEQGAILAPGPFASEFSDAVPSQFSFFRAPSTFETVIVHKGLLDELSRSFLKRFIGETRYVFGNEVFVVFTRSGRPPAADPKQAHGASFFSWAKEALAPPAARPAETGRSAGLFSWAKKSWAKKALAPSAEPRPGNAPPRALIASANGYGNLGDDVITQVVADLLHEAIPGVEVTITRPAPQRELVDKADLIVVGGGGILYDVVMENALNYAQYLLWAQEMGKPALMIGVGTQGIRTEQGRELYRAALSSCRFISVRDDDDKRILDEKVGVGCPVVLAQDLAFLLKEGPAPDLGKTPGRPLLLYSLMDATKLLAAPHLASYTETAEACLPSLMERYDVRFFLQSHDDVEMYRQWRDRYGIPIINVGNQLDTVIGLYRQADLVLTSRFHGLLFSCLAGVPVIPVSSPSGKIGRIISHALPSLRPNYIASEKLTMAELSKRMDLFERGELKAVDAAEVGACREASRRNFTALQDAVAQIREPRA